MLAYAVQQLRRWLAVEVSEVCAVESGISRQILRKIEAERQFPLKPRLHRVPVGGDDLWRRVRRERRNMLVGGLAHQFGISPESRMLGGASPTVLNQDRANIHQQH